MAGEIIVKVATRDVDATTFVPGNASYVDKNLEKIEAKAKAMGEGWTVTDYITFVAVNSRVVISIGKTPEQDLVETLKCIGDVLRHGGVNTSSDLLENRRSQAYQEYLSKISDCTNEKQKS